MSSRALCLVYNSLVNGLWWSWCSGRGGGIIQPRAKHSFIRIQRAPSYNTAFINNIVYKIKFILVVEEFRTYNCWFVPKNSKRVFKNMIPRFRGRLQDQFPSFVCFLGLNSSASQTTKVLISNPARYNTETCLILIAKILGAVSPIIYLY